MSFIVEVQELVKQYPVKVSHMVDRDKLVARLDQLKSEWQEVAEGEGVSLYDLKANVGDLLDDFFELL